MKLYDTAAVCDQLGCDKSTVSRWATRLGIGQVLGRARVFTAADVRRIKRAWRGRAGNPNFGRPKITPQA
jgi:hypothetical protein